MQRTDITEHVRGKDVATGWAILKLEGANAAKRIVRGGRHIQNEGRILEIDEVRIVLWGAVHEIIWRQGQM